MVIPLPRLSLAAYLHLTFAISLALCLAWGIRQDQLRARYHSAWDAEVSAHVQTKANYIEAQRESSLMQDANIRRVETDAATQIAGKVHDYETKLSALRADFAHQLHDAPKATCSFAGAADSGKTSEVSILSRGTVQAGGDALISAHDAQLGLENSERLQSLIDAWKAAQQSFNASP